MPRPSLCMLCTVLLTLGIAPALTGRAAAQSPQQPTVRIAAVMVDPSAVSDELGEWLQLRNDGSQPIALTGWRLDSGRDPGWVIPAGVTIPAHGTLTFARNADPAVNGGVHAALAYTGLTFANAGDWLALRDPQGTTRDSVAWGRAPSGVPVLPHGDASGDARPAPAAAPAVTPAPTPAPPRPQPQPAPATSGARSPLVVRMLDVGQGDAILVQNGGSSILIDGGPNPRALGAHLDALQLNGTTVDAVILTHPHADHYQGLRELFASRRHITVRYFWENQDPSPNATLARLRDSIGARVPLGLVYRDTDDPCATGQPLCVITMRGGAKLEIMRPDPIGKGANNRSPALKLVGPDSASFTMWMAGDAEHEALQYFERAGYAVTPGMKVDVLKADHHGSCNGVTDRYLDLTRPGLVVVSVGAVNDYGHMHEQAKAMFARHHIPWLRTDQNGTITLTSPGTPGGRYTVAVERGAANASGPSDRRSTQPGCAGM